LLYAINEGKDEITGELVVPDIPPLKNDILDYEEVFENYKKVLRYVSVVYVKANNIIHYMHDKYAYEASQMALHSSLVDHLMAFGIAGFSVAVDSLSAIKHTSVHAIRDNRGIAIEFEHSKPYEKFGNNIDKVDNIGCELVEIFMNYLRKYPLYKNATPTLSILTITSNVVYGKKTGATPDGR